MLSTSRSSSPGSLYSSDKCSMDSFEVWFRPNLDPAGVRKAIRTIQDQGGELEQHEQGQQYAKFVMDELTLFWLKNQHFILSIK